MENGHHKFSESAAHEIKRLGFERNSDNLGTYYSDTLRPDLSIVVRINFESGRWHVIGYCPATKSHYDFPFLTSERAFEMARVIRWSSSGWVNPK